MSFISFENVYFSFSDENENIENILTGINLNIEKGEFVTILGRNGSGKSTVAKIMNGLLKATLGKVCIDGICPDTTENIWEIRKKVGMIFQNPDNQIVESIVDMDVAFGCENLGIKPDEIEKRVVESLDAVGMLEYKNAMTAYLSGGQKQRIAIAGILAMKPECIIFDESTSMLDPLGRKQILDIMQKLHKAGITIINITHFMNEALISEKVIIIDKGIVLKSDKPENIFCDVPFMQNINLNVPQITELAYLLSKKGYNISKKIFNVESFFEEISKYPYQKNNVLNANIEPNNSEKIIELQNVDCIYAQGTAFEKQALKNISFNIKKGEFIAVIGQTGSGKSTLMQVFNALVKASRGNVLYKNKSIYAKEFAKDLHSKIGIVFQYPEHQIFEMTVFEDVAFAPKKQGLTEDEVKKRVEDSLKAVGLSKDYFKKSPFQLSGGEKRRVAIAGVLAMNPEILILDEPTAALDPNGREEIMNYIKNVHINRKITVIIVSHSMDDVAKFADKAIVMHNGEAVLKGTIDEVFKNNLDKFGLCMPEMSEVVRYFHSKGYELCENAYTVSKMVQEIEKCFKK